MSFPLISHCPPFRYPSLIYVYVHMNIDWLNQKNISKSKNKQASHSAYGVQKVYTRICVSAKVIRIYVSKNVSLLQNILITHTCKNKIKQSHFALYDHQCIISKEYMHINVNMRSPISCKKVLISPHVRIDIVASYIRIYA